MNWTKLNTICKVFYLILESSFGPAGTVKLNSTQHSPDVDTQLVSTCELQRLHKLCHFSVMISSSPFEVEQHAASLVKY